MGFFSGIINFFESLFSGLSPESKQKQDIRKIEAELKTLQPPVYKNGAALPAFAEAFRLLQVNTKPIESILSATFRNQDINIRNHYASVLVETGLSDRAKAAKEKLLYENRKNEFFAVQNEQRIIDSQRHDLELIQREGLSFFYDERAHVGVARVISVFVLDDNVVTETVVMRCAYDTSVRGCDNRVT